MRQTNPQILSYHFKKHNQNHFFLQQWFLRVLVTIQKIQQPQQRYNDNWQIFVAINIK